MEDRGRSLGLVNAVVDVVTVNDTSAIMTKARRRLGGVKDDDGDEDVDVFIIVSSCIAACQEGGRLQIL
jgi:hypothetical protein